MQNKTIKLGVAGLKRGRDIVSDIIGDENIILRAICDKNEKTLSSAKEFFLNEKKLTDVLVFDSLEEMLKSDIDAVIIATDAPLHTQHSIMALEAGKHVLSEIPVAFTLEEAQQLKDAVKRHPELKYMAGENCCFWAFIESWKQMREKGMFGEVVYAEGEYLHAGDPDKFDSANYPESHWRTTLNAIRYSTHQLGPLLYVMDDECVSVSCM